MPSCEASVPPLPIEQCTVPAASHTTAVCTSSQAIDGTCCPGGMACGVDGICHAPSGTFAGSAIVETFDAELYAIEDVNGDLVQDVIGPSPAAVEVRYGNPQTPLATELVQPSPEPTSATASFVDIEQNGSPALVIPARAGLFAYDNSTGSPEPLAFPVDGANTAAGAIGIVDGVNHMRIAPVIVGGELNSAVELDYVAMPGSGSSNYQMHQLVVPNSLFPLTSLVQYAVTDTNPTLCGAKGTVTLRGHTIHPYVDTATIRVPIAIGALTLEICVETANPSTAGVGASYSITHTALPSGYNVAPDGETFFANLVSAAGACPDLVITLRDAVGNDYWLLFTGSGTAGTNACTVNTTASATAVPLHGRPLAPITLATAAAPNGLITSAGVYSYNATTAQWTLVNQSTRDWTFARVADVNGDGLEDFAVQTLGTDVEVFRQTAPLLTIVPPFPPGTAIVIPQWSEFLIPTDEDLSQLEFGDFDGDGHQDLAIAATESSSPLAIPPTDLSIAWGNGDGTFTPEAFGSIDELTTFAAMNLYDSSLPLGDDVTDDLLIARGGAVIPGNANTSGDAALLIADYGSTARALTGPFVYASTFNGQESGPLNGTAIAAVGGYIGVNGLPAVLGVFAPPEPANVSPTSYAAVVLNYDATNGTFQSTPEATIPAGECTSGVSGPCFPYNVALQMRRDAGTLVLTLPVGFTVSSTCAGYFIADGVSAPSVTPLTCGALAAPGNGSAFTALQALGATALLDNDGTTAHVLLASSTSTGVTSSAYVWALTVTSSGPQLANPIELNTELASSGILAAGDTVLGCLRGTELELGTRTVGGVAYGANQAEIVIQCNIQRPPNGSSKSPSGGDVQLFARYASPSGGMPHYEMIWDTGSPLPFTTFEHGDINGDGLPDLVFTQGGSTKVGRALQAILQCDAHGCGGVP
jgi:hypothetical protein